MEFIDRYCKGSRNLEVRLAVPLKLPQRVYNVGAILVPSSNELYQTDKC